TGIARRNGRSPRRPPMTRLVPWISAAFLISASYLVAQTPNSGSMPASGRVVHSLPKDRSMPPDLADGTRTSAIAISPDGRTVVYRAEEGGQFRLYQHVIGQSQDVTIAEPGAAYPFFSADSRSIGYSLPSPSGGFAAGAVLKRVTLSSGPAQAIVKDV